MTYNPDSWRHLVTPRAQTGSHSITTHVTPEELEAVVLGLGASHTKSGARVTATSAMNVAAVYACVRVISEGVAQLPLRLYDKRGAVPVPAAGTTLDELVSLEPNPWQSPFEFFRYAAVCLLLRGNFYAEKFMLGSSKARLIPLHPDQMDVEWNRETGEIEYTYRQDGAERKYRADQLVHVRGLSDDGLKGKSVISQAREAIGLNMQAENHGARLFTNGANPGVMLEHPGRLSPEAADRLRQSFEDRYGGADNAHKTVLLEEGMKATKLGMTADELQFIESRKFQRSEIAMFFGVPPHMIGDIERGTSWGSGIEEQGLGFVRYTLRPWLTNIRQAFDRALLTRLERRRLGFAFDADELTRGDFKTRQEGLAIQKANGVITAAQWAAREGLEYQPEAEPEQTTENPPADAGNPTNRPALRVV